MMRMRRVLKYIFRVFLLWLLFVALCLVIVPFFHKKADAVTIEDDAAYEYTAPERVRSIDQNEEALLWRLRLIEAAEQRIILSTFDFVDDEAGRDIMSALWAAANRGVNVQILVDGINGALFLSGSPNFRQLSSHENVEVRFYNPINLLMPWRINYRMHDKYLIADHMAYLLGGRNTDNRFLGNYEEDFNADRDILVYETEPGQGKSFRQLEDYFNRIWNLPCCKPFQRTARNADLEARYESLKGLYPEAFSNILTPSDMERATIEAESISLWSNPIEPENKVPVLWYRMIDAMTSADNVLVQTPYIICSKDMYADLQALCSTDRQVDIMINAVEIGSNPFGCTDYLNQKKKLQETGVHMYEYFGEYAQHTKAVLVGNDLTIAGSCNFDMRSVYLDTELMLAIHCPKLNAQIRMQLDSLKEGSRHMYPDGTLQDGPAYAPVEPSFGKNLMYGFLRVVIMPLRHLL